MNFKTSTEDANTLATRWYALLGRAPDPAGLAHWVQQIQQDGSNTAWQNFANSPEPKAAGVIQKAAALKMNPIELTPGQGQLPGTNTKSLSGFADAHPWIRTAGDVLGAAGGGPLGAWVAHSVTKPGGGLNSYVHDVAIPAAALGAGAIGAGALGAGGAGALGTAASKIPDLLKGLGGKAADFLGGNGGLNALGIAQGINAAALGKKSTEYATKAGDLSMQNWTANQPLRDQGRAGMLKTAALPPTDLSGLNVGGNPFRPRPATPPATPPLTAGAA